jgi:hypothetical protein
MARWEKDLLTAANALILDKCPSGSHILGNHDEDDDA